MRHALRIQFRDSTARFLYLLHPVSAKKKEKCLRTFVSASTPVPTRAIIFRPTSHCLQGSYIPPPNHTCKRNSSKKCDSPLARELPEYYLSCWRPRNYVLFRQSCGKVLMGLDSRYFSTSSLVSPFTFYSFFFLTQNV